MVMNLQKKVYKQVKEEKRIFKLELLQDTISTWLDATPLLVATLEW